MEEKTAVFSFGSLACEPEPRSYDVDEPTRELPLISGRFAGREWVAEDLRREYEQKKTAQRTRPARRNAVLAAAGCFAAAALLVGALMGQTRLTAMNDEAVAVSEEITVLQREQNALRIRYEQTLSSSRAERDAAQVFLLQSAAENASDDAEETATVLHIRRGRQMHHYWQSFVDTLGASFR